MSSLLMSAQQCGRRRSTWGIKWGGRQLAMEIALRRRGFRMVVGILVMLFCSGRCQGIIAAPCNGTIGSCHAEDELFVDTTEINIYEAVEFVMDSEISRRILANTHPYQPLKPGTARPGARRGHAYTRPCTFANHCERGTPPRP